MEDANNRRKLYKYYLNTGQRLEKDQLDTDTQHQFWHFSKARWKSLLIKRLCSHCYKLTSNITGNIKKTDRSLRPSIRQAVNVLRFEAPLPSLLVRMPVATFMPQIVMSSAVTTGGGNSTSTSSVATGVGSSSGGTNVSTSSTETSSLLKWKAGQCFFLKQINCTIESDYWVVCSGYSNIEFDL